MATGGLSVNGDKIKFLLLIKVRLWKENKRRE